MRKSLALGVAAVMTTGLAALVPTAANATTCASSAPCSTDVTFAISGGTLNLTVPSAVDFSSSAFTVTGLTSTYTPTWPSASPIQVSDLRLLSIGWTDTVSALSTWTGTGTNSMSTAGSTLSALNGCGTPVGATLTTAPVALTAGGPLIVAVTTGNNSVSCVPTLSISVPPTATADTYTGTIVQTVA